MRRGERKRTGGVNGKERKRRGVALASDPRFSNVPVGIPTPVHIFFRLQPNHAEISSSKFTVRIFTQVEFRFAVWQAVW